MNSFNGSNYETLLKYFEHMYDKFVEESFDFFSQPYLLICKRFKDEMRKDPNAPEGFDMGQITRAIREVVKGREYKMKDDKIDEVAEIPRNTASEDIALENSKIELKDKIEHELRNELHDEVETGLRDELWDEVKQDLRNELCNEVKYELRDKLKDEVKAGLENEMRNEVKIELKKKLYDEAKNELKEEMRSKVEKELEHKLRNDESLNRGIYDRVRQELHDKFTNEMNKEDIRNEVKGKFLYNDIINNVLNSAIEHDCPEIVKLLINNYYVNLEAEDESGMTLLMKAAKNKRYHIVRMILNKISDSSVDSDNSNESSEVLSED